MCGFPCNLLRRFVLAQPVNEPYPDLRLARQYSCCDADLDRPESDAYRRLCCLRYPSADRLRQICTGPRCGQARLRRMQRFAGPACADPHRRTARLCRPVQPAPNAATPPAKAAADYPMGHLRRQPADAPRYEGSPAREACPRRHGLPQISGPGIVRTAEAPAPIPQPERIERFARISRSWG